MNSDQMKAWKCGLHLSLSSGARERRGLTIVEVLISMVLLTIIVGAFYTGTELAYRGSTLNAQRVAAYGLCQDRFEQMRGGSFSDITYAKYPTQTVRITTGTGLNATNIITGSISSTITNLVNPSRKMISITTQWNYRNRSNQETLVGCLVDRAAAASLQGTLSGKLFLNPDGDDPLQFLLTLPSGSTMDFSNITNLPMVGYTMFYAQHLRVQVGGGGMQTTVQFNYQTFPMSNAKQWDIDAPTSFRASFKYETNGVGVLCWRVRLTGFNTTISTP